MRPLIPLLLALLLLPSIASAAPSHEERGPYAGVLVDGSWNRHYYQNYDENTHVCAWPPEFTTGWRDYYVTVVTSNPAATVKVHIPQQGTFETHRGVVVISFETWWCARGTISVGGSDLPGTIAYTMTVTEGRMELDPPPTGPPPGMPIQCDTIWDCRLE